MSDESRRRLLKKLAMGGATIVAGKTLPNEWTKPVIESVLLPAHAQTSPPEPEPPTYSISCTRTDPTGTDLPINYPQVEATWDITPVPTTPYEVTFNLTCDGVDSNVTPQILPWPANTNIGQFGVGNPSSTYFSNCAIGDSYVARVEAFGVISDCTWTVGQPAFCLASDTSILCAGNNYKIIESLQIGDMVSAIDSDGSSILTVVTKVITKHMRSDHYIINSDLRITDDHPVLVARDESLAWCRVDGLSIGDQILSTNSFVEITSIEYSNKPLETVYVETQCGNFIAKSGSDHYIVKSTYADAEKRLEKGELEVFA